MAIIRQGAERPPADTTSPAGVVELLRRHLQTEADLLPPHHKDRVPLLGQYRGLGQELEHAYHFVTLIAILGGMSVTAEQARTMHGRLDPHRLPANVDPERRLAADVRKSVTALPHDHNHPAIRIGTLLIEGLAEGRSPAARWAVEALVAIRMQLADDMLNAPAPAEHIAV